MRTLVTGSSGLVGSFLLPELAADGHPAIRLVRREPREDGELFWDPAAAELPAATREALEGLDVVVHLAGANIADGRWTARRKREIETSRTAGTGLLARSLASLEAKPEVLVSASAVGIYGDRGAGWVDSSSLAGSGFLAEVCRRWEAATEPARDAGIRVVRMRFGVILHPRRGALARMKLPFRLGLGGPMGRGSQFLSWIAIQDAVGALRHVISHPELEGPIDAVAPHPVTNLEFSTALAGVYKRKARLRVPKRVARLLFGELADELLLSGQRVRPTALLRSGYAFELPELVQALRLLLDRPKKDEFPAPDGAPG
jgi:hypothetical protein